MHSGKGDYGRLLPVRPELFPMFREDQQMAVHAISSAVIVEGTVDGVEAVVDLGCGTGEILAGVRDELASYYGADVEAFGIDACRAQVEQACVDWPLCRFEHATCEEWLHENAGKVRAIRSPRTIVLCVGHTICHFQNLEVVLDRLCALTPSHIVMDFHDGWDDVVARMSTGRCAPVRIRKSGREGAGGGQLEFDLTTMLNPDDETRVLRGVEFADSKRRGPLDFWTSQACRDSAWFHSGLVARGYESANALAYRAGYGPMYGWVFKRRDRSPGTDTEAVETE